MYGSGTPSGSYQSSAQSSAGSNRVGGATFGDVNVGQGAGSGFKFSPMTLALLAGAVLLGIYLWKR